jgi:hypothetical protein
MLEILRKVFDFSDWQSSHPTEPPPGDMLDASFDAQDKKINELTVLIESIKRSDGNLQNSIVDWDALTADLKARLRQDAAKEVKSEAEKALSAASEALSAQNQARIASETAESAQKASEDAQIAVFDAKTTILSQISAQKSRAETLLAQLTASEADLRTMEEDWQTSRAEAEAWAYSSYLWAEHMPDTLPDNAVKMMDISGDHWSSRWWANRADNAFGRLTDLYLGAWADPPTQNLEGGPIETGSIYYDTDEHQPYVWDGANWVPFWTPGRSVTSSLWYRATDGQTVFPFSVPDQNGNTFAYDPTHPEGTEIHVNGIRLTPDYGSSAEADYAINTTSSTLTLNRPLRVGDILSVTLLLPPESLAPGAVTVWSLNTLPETPDGTTVAFALTTKATGGPTVSISKSEEVLVSLDGVIQEPGFSYTAIGSTLTFVSPPEINARLFITWLQAAAPGGGTVIAPTPTITISSLSPSSGARSTSVSVAVAGVDLQPGDVIVWDGGSVATNYVWSGQITTDSVTLGPTPRSVPVHVERGSEVSNELTFTVT